MGGYFIVTHAGNAKWAVASTHMCCSLHKEDQLRVVLGDLRSTDAYVSVQPVFTMLESVVNNIVIFVGKFSVNPLL